MSDGHFVDQDTTDDFLDAELVFGLDDSHRNARQAELACSAQALAAIEDDVPRW